VTSHLASPSPPLRPLLAGIVALAAAMGIGRVAVTPILPAMLAAGRLDTTQAGLLASANYAGYLIGALAVALAVPRSAQTLVLRVSAIAVAATTALMAVTTGLAGWGFVRFASGLASAGVFVLASGLVLDALRQQGQAARSGWLYSGVGLGIVISGTVVRATGGALGWRADWTLLALLAAVAIYPGWRWLPRSLAAGTATETTRGIGLGIVSPALLLLFAAYFLEGVGYIVSGTFLVAIVDGMPGLAGLGTGVWIVVGLAVIPSSALWAASAARIGYSRALVAAYALQGCGIALPLAGGAGAAFASAVLFGGTFAGITALTLALAGFLAPRRSASLIGALTASFGIGQVIGPLLAGLIAGRAHGFAPALIVASGVIFVAAALMATLYLCDGASRTGRRFPHAVSIRAQPGDASERE
jgi:predicted MFS family arabinose efflux permease